MKRVLLALTGILLGAPVNSNAVDPALPLQGKMVEEVSAAVTDMPEITDMSYADPQTWHSLPPAVSDEISPEEVRLSLRFSGRARPF